MPEAGWTMAGRTVVLVGLLSLVLWGLLLGVGWWGRCILTGGC